MILYRISCRPEADQPLADILYRTCLAVALAEAGILIAYFVLRLKTIPIIVTLERTLSLPKGER